MKRWSAKRFGIVAFGVAALFAVGAHFTGGTQFQIDLNSGRQRWGVVAYGLFVPRGAVDSDFWRLLGSKLDLNPTPDWRPYHVKFWSSSARINYRYGGVPTDLRVMMQCFELYEVPEQVQVLFAREAIDALKDGNRFLLECGDHGFELRSHEDQLIRAWPAPDGTPTK